MSYVVPGLVRSPKYAITAVNVIYDGGEWYEACPKWVGCSAAEVEWWDTVRLGLRWNGSHDAPIGMPQSRGIPTWFIVPEPLEDAIREALKSAPMPELRESA